MDAYLIFIDELEKVSVDTRDLAVRMQKAWSGRQLRMPAGSLQGNLGAAQTVHPSTAGNPLYRPFAGKLITTRGGGGIGTSLLNQARQGAALGDPDSVKQGISFVPESMRSFVAKRNLKQGESLGSIPETMSVAGRRALGDIGRAHEKFELTTPKRNIVPGAHHMSPALVLSKEHNLVSRLTGPGSGEATSAMKTIRGATDGDYMKGLLGRSFGPRAVEMYRSGEKIPRAMRKALARREPEYIQHQTKTYMDKFNLNPKS